MRWLKTGTPALDQGPRDGALTRSTAWLAVGTIGGLLLALLQTPILFRVLPPGDFGLWALGFGLGLAVATLDFGLGAATTRFMTVALAVDDVRRARGAFLFSLTSAAVMLLVSGAVTASFQPELVSLVESRYSGSSSVPGFLWATFALLAVYLLNTIGRYALVALSDFRSVGVWQLIGQLLVLVATAAGAISGDSATTLLWLTVAAAGVQASVYLTRSVWLLWRMAVGPDLKNEGPPVKEMIRFAAWMQLNGLSLFLNSQTDKLVITGVSSTVAVAPFETANTMARVTRVVPGQYLVALSNPMARASTGPDSGVARQFDDSLRHMARINLAPASLLIGLSPLILSLWLGHIPQHAEFMFVALALGNLVNNFTGPGTVYLRTVGRPGPEVTYGLIQTILNLSLSIWLGLEWGAPGVVAATGISAVVSSAVFLLLFRRVTNLRAARTTSRLVLRLSLLAVLVAAVAFVGASWVVGQHPQTLAQFLGLVGLGLVSMVALLVCDASFWLGMVKAAGTKIKGLCTRA